MPEWTTAPNPWILLATGGTALAAMALLAALGRLARRMARGPMVEPALPTPGATPPSAT